MNIQPFILLITLVMTVCSKSRGGASRYRVYIFFLPGWSANIAAVQLGCRCTDNKGTIDINSELFCHLGVGSSELQISDVLFFINADVYWICSFRSSRKWGLVVRLVAFVVAGYRGPFYVVFLDHMLVVLQEERVEWEVAL